MSFIMENLLYRRQFVLSREEISDRPNWNNYTLPFGYFLYAHPDVAQTDIKEKSKRLILIGNIYDPFNKTFKNQDIAARLIQNDTINDLAISSSGYAGRFLILFCTSDEIFIFNDASASRKVYYSSNSGPAWCASQPHVLAEYLKIEKSEDPKVKAYYKSKEFHIHFNSGIRNNTVFDAIKQLQPNHYLNLKENKVVRFWPAKKNKLISMNEGVEAASEMLKGIINSAHERDELMMAVTAGNDTRLLLAASREVSDDIYYYVINIPRYDEKHQDIVVPTRMLKKIGLKFNVLNYSNEVDEDFKKIYLKNNLFANEGNLSTIYNIYHKKFPNKINMPGSFSDIARSFFNTYRKDITPELLATIWEYKGVEYAIEQYRIWQEEAGIIAKEYNYGLLELFNWEERNGNLYTQFQVDKDIAQEEFTPYNCRNLMEIFLSVPKKYRDVHTNIYFRAMIKHMWPELLTEPFNPNMKKYASYYLKKTHVYWPIRRVIRGW